MNEKYVLTKKDPIRVYFKYKDRTGHTFTSIIYDAMYFNDKNEAVEYNHKWLYGECDIMPVGAAYHNCG